MHKILPTLGLLATVLSAQESLQVGDALLREQLQAGQRFSSVSRDGGQTWSRPVAIDHQLHLKFGSFDPLRVPVIPAGLRATADNRLFVCQFHHPIIEEFRAELRQLGVEICRYLPSQSYLVRMGADLQGKLQALDSVRAVLPFHPAFRLDAAILAKLGKNTGAQRYDLVFVDRRKDAVGLEARVQQLGGELLIPSGGGVLCDVVLDEKQLRALSQDPRCLWIGTASAPELDIDNARVQGGVNYVETVAGIDGTGMTGHVCEGVHRTHTEFAAIPGVRQAPIAPFNSSSSGHGTNTAGEIYARGVRNGYRGLLPNAQMTYTNYNYLYNNSNRYPMTATLIQNHQVMFDTASWGYSRTTQYTARSAEMDAIIFDQDFYMTNSQSNAGSTSNPRNSRPQAWAKNITSVGGFRHRNNSLASDDYWGRSGSTGPAADGRIGVTLSAYYDSIGTTSGSSSYTTGFGGTSGATPIINGLSGNAIEMFTDGLFGYEKTAAETAVERQKVLPHFSTTKSLLIATADQVTYNSSGTSTGANRYQQGWGFPSLRRLFDERDRLLVIDELDVLAQNESRSYYLFARGGRFVASMNHPDPEAAANAGIHRINSVDLKVETADGKSYWGNNGLLNGPVSSAGGSANDRDTEETVILDKAPKGLTVVTVEATGVRQDGHVETRANDVDYALVVQGLQGLRDESGLKLELSSARLGDLGLRLSQLPAGWKLGFTIFSLETSRPVSTGNLFGLEFDSLSSSLVRITPAAGNPFAFTDSGGASAYPQAKYQFDAGLASTLSGVTLDAVAVLTDGQGDIVDVSNVERITVQ